MSSEKVTANPPQPGDRVMVEAEIESIGRLGVLVKIKTHQSDCWRVCIDMEQVHPSPQPAKKGE